MGDKKRQVLDQALQAIEKQFGKGSIQKLSNSKVEKIPVISTGSLALDLALGVGGIPRGRIIEIYGPEASGKSTLALHIIKEAQEAGGVAAFVDMEHAMSLQYASDLGVDVENLIFSQPDYGEQALQTAEILASSGAVDIIVIDSVSALVPKAEIEGDMIDQQMGLQARMMGKGCRKLAGIVSKSNTCLVFINQLRQNIGVMFGNPEVTTGGNALKFFASVRMDIRRIEAIKVGTSIIGSKNRVKVVKNKVAPPFKETVFTIIFGKGIDRYQEILDLAVSFGLIKKSGAWFTYGEDRFQGASQVLEAFKKDEVFFNTISKMIEERSLVGQPVIIEEGVIE